MPRVPTETLVDAQQNFAWGKIPPYYWTQEHTKLFQNHVGITDKQWADYEESWSLYVSKITLKKIEVLATKPQQHWHSLFKVIDAKYGWK